MPDHTRPWRSPASQNMYFLRYRIRLRAPDTVADLEVTMEMENQEFQEQAGGLWDYEGIAEVRGQLNGRSVKGHAFVEAVPSTKNPDR